MIGSCLNNLKCWPLLDVHRQRHNVWPSWPAWPASTLLWWGGLGGRLRFSRISTTTTAWTKCFPFEEKFCIRTEVVDHLQIIRSLNSCFSEEKMLHSSNLLKGFWRTLVWEDVELSQTWWRFRLIAVTWQMFCGGSYLQVGRDGVISQPPMRREVIFVSAKVFIHMLSEDFFCMFWLLMNVSI